MPLLRKDNCRSARIFKDVQGFSVQIVQEIFRGAFGNVLHFWASSSLKILEQENLYLKVILVFGECLV